MRVSVVIPTYNRASLVERAVASVCAQTLPALEILVVDDGSTDGTAERLADRFPAVEVLRQRNRGVSAARNLGISCGTGEWIALLDSDDEWLPEKLERQCAALAAAPEHKIVHCDEIWIRGGRRVNPRVKHRKSGGWIFERCLPLCAISPSAVLLQRRLLVEHGGFDEALPACEDYDLWLRLSARERVLYVDEPLVVKHGGRDDQLSRTVWGLDRFRIRALDRALRNPVLTERQRDAVRSELASKLEIFVAGARKHGRHRAAGELERRYAPVLAGQQG